MGAASLALLAWLTLHWGLLPRLEGWRPQIESRLSTVLGVRVAIGRIEATSSGWVPGVRLHDVRLLDSQSRVALRVPLVSAALSPRSLLGTTPRFEQIYIEGAEVQVRRDPLGRIHLAGFEWEAGTDAASVEAAQELVDWFFRQREFVLRGGRVAWADEMRLAPPIDLTDVQVVVRNGLRSHDWRIDATPPADFGARFSARGRFTQDLLARPGDWTRWTGQLYAEWPRGDLQRLRRHVDLPFELQEGAGSLRAWVDLRHAQVQAVTTDLALNDVALRLAPGLDVLAVHQLTGRLAAHRTRDALTLEARDLAFEASGLDPAEPALTAVTAGAAGPARAQWPRANALLVLKQRQDGGFAASGLPVTAGDLTADLVDIDTLARIARALPLGAALHNGLEGMRPKGRLHQVALRWEGPMEAPFRYRVALRGEQLSVMPGVPAKDAEAGLARPGFDGARVDLKADEKGGEARLQILRGRVVLPGVFDDPVLPFSEASSTLRWRVDPSDLPDMPPRLRVTSEDLRFVGPDGPGQVSWRWETGMSASGGPGGYLPGRLDLVGSMPGARVERIARYLPRALPAASRTYVAEAFSAGRASDISVRVAGDLHDFPFVGPAPPAVNGPPPASEFRVQARLEGVRYTFTPWEPGIWPALDDVAGDLLIDHGELTFRQASARLASGARSGTSPDTGAGGAPAAAETAVTFSNVEARIANLAFEPSLQLRAVARGRARSLLDAVARTPIHSWTGGAMDGFEVTGEATLPFELTLPIDRPADARISGHVQLEGNDLRVADSVPALTAVRARVNFTETSWSVKQAQASVAGGEVRVDANSTPAGGAAVQAQGTATAEGLRTVPELGLVTRLVPWLSGSSAYQAQWLLAPDGGQSLTVQSTLAGMTSQLPLPLRKTASLAWPLKVQITTPASPNPAAPLAPPGQLNIDLADMLQVRYLRTGTGAQERIVGGSIVVGPAPAAAPMLPVVARVQVAEANVDEWQDVLDRVFGLSTGPPAATAAGNPTSSYAPTQVMLKAPVVHAMGHRWQQVDATWVPLRSGWNLDVTSTDLSGRLEWRPEGAGRVRARLSQASVSRGTSGRAAAATPTQAPVTAQSPAPAAPAAYSGPLPAIDLVVDDLRWGGVSLGRAELEASTRTSPGGAGQREWRIARLLVHHPRAELLLQSPWMPQPPPATAAAPPGRTPPMTWRLDVGDSGDLLDELGLGRSIRGGKGVVQGKITWLGSPLLPDFASLAGELNLAVESGQFLKVDPGAAKLLSVLSLQSLPRRLLFDFRDVTQEGFRFDSITGDVRIEAGVARTNNLRMVGVQGVALLDGEADLQHETQRLKVMIVPEINAGTASLAYTAINPALGLTTFLAQMVLRRPLALVGTREFLVTGPWAEPKVERIERTPATGSSSYEASPIEPVPPNPTPATTPAQPAN